MHWVYGTSRPQLVDLLRRGDELRGRLIRASVVLLTTWFGAFYFAKDLLNILKAPLMEALSQSQSVLHFTGPLEVFLSYLHISFAIAVAVCAPYLFYQGWRFVSPAISGDKKPLITSLFTSSLALFFAGVLFAFKVLIPPALTFLVAVDTAVAKPLITVGEYTSLVLYLMLGAGVVSQLPLVLIILVRLGLLKIQQLRQGRGVAIVLILIVAAIVTPTPDPFTQLCMAGPMYLLYEAAILFLAFQERQSAEKALPTDPLG